MDIELPVHIERQRAAAVYRSSDQSMAIELSEDTLVAVSDKKKARQPKRCAAKDQSIHVFRIPSS